MAGIYIHVPYCKSACAYCDFYFSTNHNSIPQFLTSLAHEIDLRKSFLKEPVSTIYFGGGTPSLLHPQAIEQIINQLRNTFTVTSIPECTLEVNPDDVSLEFFNDLKKAGINRISLGLQTFDDDELKHLNRIHNANRNIEAIQFAKAAGFENITVDLIYGSPWLTDKQWKLNIQQVLSLNIPHISCYQLTIEEKTKLHYKIKTGKIPLPDEDKIASQFIILINELKKEGYEHYEVSNFAKPGFYSLHNTSYWKDIPYLGLGPSAHGYDGIKRYMNISNIHNYNKLLGEEKTWYESEEIDDIKRYNEMILTGLRTTFGVNLTNLVSKLDQSYGNYFQRKAQKYLDSGQMEVRNYIYTLTEEAFLFADKISADLFYI